MVIPRGERGMVHVFHVDRPDAELSNLEEGRIGGALLGVNGIVADQLELFPVRNLEGLGLSGYLTEGHGIADSEIAADASQLDLLEGYVLLVRSAAISPSGGTLSLASGVSHIATYPEERTDWSAGPIEATSAKPHTGSTRSPREARAEARRMGGTVFTIFMVLIGLVLLAVLLI
ncbi:hypothetical protein CFI11_20395 [Thalassococcus sp. S3]|nr:hypothetical protein CFI11_20395 [Thalassococcus sp. S3]